MRTLFSEGFVGPASLGRGVASWYDFCRPAPATASAVVQSRGGAPAISVPISVLGMFHVKSYVEVLRSCRWCGAEVCRGLVSKCRSRLLTVIENNEVRPEIPLVLLKNGMLENPVRSFCIN
ncbi:hypothetical protein AVEN_97806-1 [Araneus ventricosus]|uniref:Uncharacterized protein n=1 Tax=Araneus ventricosus TaxID=182803 RepID=A0A4Y2VPS1_ARAVE|nr:hypothetical protein AVEN_97806-1 [Araneus ventricosus]